MPRSILMVACEESADNYGALLAQELRAQRPDLELFGLGGDRMQAAGVQLLENMLEHSATGLVEVFRSLSFFLKTMKKTAEEASQRNAPLAILIDSPDFNLRLAPQLKAQGMKVVYYISPQLWAWRAGRIKYIRRFVDAMVVAFPFEQTWYQERGVQAHFPGHPLLDLLQLEELRSQGTLLRQELSGQSQGPLIGILPGSRRNEVTRLLPRFLMAARILKQHLQSKGKDPDFVIACARWLNPERLKPFLNDYQDLEIKAVHNKSHQVMAASDFLFCASGTATLEAGLLGTPLLMAYLLSFPTWLLSQIIISQDQYFCLPNIILGKELVPEMIQFRSNPQTLACTAIEILDWKLEDMRRELAGLEARLGGPGASRRTAEIIQDLL